MLKENIVLTGKEKTCQLHLLKNSKAYFIGWEVSC